MICDFAETYNIYEYRGLSPRKVAVLLLGLRDDSRVKMKLSGNRITLEQMLMAIMADNLKFLSWTKTKDAKKGVYKEKSILKALMGEYDHENDNLVSFKTVEEYEAYMKQFIKE